MATVLLEYLFCLLYLVSILYITNQGNLFGITSLEFAFETKSLRQICEDEKSAIRKLGEGSAKKLFARLSDLRAAWTIDEIPANKPFPVELDDESAMAINIGATHILYFVPNHISTPNLDSGGVDWMRVNRIKLVKIKKNG